MGAISRFVYFYKKFIKIINIHMIVEV